MPERFDCPLFSSIPRMSSVCLYFSFCFFAACPSSVLFGLQEMPKLGISQIQAEETITNSGSDVPLNSSVVSDIIHCSNTNQLIACGDDHIVRIFDLEGDQSPQELLFHRDWIQTIDYCQHTNVAATAGNDRQVLFWDIEEKNLVGKVTLPSAIRDISFNSKGTKLAVVGFESRLRILDTSKGWNNIRTTVVKCRCLDLLAVVFSPDEKKVGIVGRDGFCSVWDVTTEQILWQQNIDSPRVRSIAFSSDGNYLIACGDRGWINILDAATGKWLSQSPSGQGKIFALALCGDDLLATAGSSNDIRLWNLQHLRRGTDVPIATMSGHTGTVTSLSYDANTRCLYSGSFDTTIRKFDLGPIHRRNQLAPFIPVDHDDNKPQ